MRGICNSRWDQTVKENLKKHNIWGNWKQSKIIQEWKEYCEKEFKEIFGRIENMIWVK